MFPSTLDNAEVIYYTSKGDYGKMYYTNGEVAAEFAYLAICKYKDSNGYYLFMCNDEYEVETDLLMDSIEECIFEERYKYLNNKSIKDTASIFCYGIFSMKLYFV